jgi:hypothetical protein
MVGYYEGLFRENVVMIKNRFELLRKAYECPFVNMVINCC